MCCRESLGTYELLPVNPRASAVLLCSCRMRGPPLAVVMTGVIALVLRALAGCGSSGNAVPIDASGDAVSQVPLVGAPESGAPNVSDASHGLPSDAAENDAQLESGASVIPDAGAGCPPVTPVLGAPCAEAGISCSYGGGICCGDAYTCISNRTWAGLASACPCTVPPSGSCPVGRTCTYLGAGVNACLLNDGGRIEYTCGSLPEGPPMACPNRWVCNSVGQGGSCYLPCGAP